MTPWRTRRRSACSPSCRGFNAATAMTPWRTPSRASRSPTASRRFNAATAMTPWRTTEYGYNLSDYLVLQCGHGDDAVENYITEILPPRLPEGFNAATA